MATFKVNVNKLNVRSSPVTNFDNKGNVVAVLLKDAVFESVGVLENELGRWQIGKNGETVSDNFVAPIQDDIPPELVKYHDKIPKIFLDFHLGKLWELPMQEGLKVGIIDTGVDVNHPALKGRVTNLNMNFPIDMTDNPNHATTMACIISGDDPENGIIGIAPGIEKIYSYTLPNDGATPDMFICALTKMEKEGVKLINISYCWSGKNFKEAEELIQKIKDLSNNGFVIICATGNESNIHSLYYPAAYPDVISTAGCNAENRQDDESNFWQGVNLCMASDYYFDRNKFNHSNGTSGATALMTGCIAHVYPLIKQENKVSFLQETFKKFNPILFSDQQLSISIPQYNTERFLTLLNS